MSMPGLLSLVTAGLEATLKAAGSSTRAFNHDIQLDAWRHSKAIGRHKKTLLIQRTVGNAVWLKMGLKVGWDQAMEKAAMVCEWRFLFYLPSNGVASQTSQVRNKMIRLYFRDSPHGAKTKGRGAWL